MLVRSLEITDPAASVRGRERETSTRNAPWQGLNSTQPPACGAERRIFLLWLPGVRNVCVQRAFLSRNGRLALIRAGGVRRGRAR